jgi:vacuolar-type H+-ATPase subunit B/Vma2
LKTEYIGLNKINGSFIFIKTPENISFNEQVHIILKNGEKRIGNVVILNEDITVIQVYERK